MPSLRAYQILRQLENLSLSVYTDFHLHQNHSCTSRLLKPGGTFLYMTWQQKQFRLMFLERPGIWDVDVQTVPTAGGQGWDYFLFVGKKK